jgi:hypothetical protein
VIFEIDPVGFRHEPACTFAETVSIVVMTVNRNPGFVETIYTESRVYLTPIRENMGVSRVRLDTVRIHDYSPGLFIGKPLAVVKLGTTLLLRIEVIGIEPSVFTVWP